MLVDATAVQNLPNVPCLDKCTPVGMQLAVLISLACQWGGLPTDVATLVANAKCFQCIPIGMRMGVLVSLAEQIATNTSPACTDADAVAFFAAAGITDATTKTAVCTLVGSLKSAGLWTLMDAIYPFAGGTAAACSYNLKNPAKYQITWHGAVTFGPTGITADGLTGYGDTGLVPSSAGGNYALNSASIGAYFAGGSVKGSGMAVAVNFNGSNNPVARMEMFPGSSPGVVFAMNDANGLTGINGSNHGLNVASRTASTTMIGYAGDGTNVTQADNSTSLPPQSFYVMAENQGGSPANFLMATCGLEFIGGAMTGAQITSLQTIVTAFETALGRA